MMKVIGLELDKALALIKNDTGVEPAVEKTSPPRGLPCENGLWRVVRADLSRGCITAAFFPLPSAGEEHAEEER